MTHCKNAEHIVLTPIPSPTLPIHQIRATTYQFTESLLNSSLPSPAEIIPQLFKKPHKGDTPIIVSLNALSPPSTPFQIGSDRGCQYWREPTHSGILYVLVFYDFILGEKCGLYRLQLGYVYKIVKKKKMF